MKYDFDKPSGYKNPYREIAPSWNDIYDEPKAEETATASVNEPVEAADNTSTEGSTTASTECSNPASAENQDATCNDNSNPSTEDNEPIYDPYEQYRRAMGWKESPAAQQPYSRPSSSPLNISTANTQVTTIFKYILMVLIPVSLGVTFLMVRDFFLSVDPSTLLSGGINVQAVMNAPHYEQYSMIDSFLNLLIYAITFLDVLKIRAKGYPVLGLIFSAIVLRPFYILWRYFIVKDSKREAVIFTCFLALIFLAYVVWVFQYTAAALVM